APAMDSLRDQLFAGAGFALDQDGRVGRRDATHQLQRLVHHAAAADDVLHAARALYLPAQTGVLELKPLFQLLYFPQRAPQPILGLAPQRDVPEHHHGSHELATVVDRGARALYGEAVARCRAPTKLPEALLLDRFERQDLDGTADSLCRVVEDTEAVAEEVLPIFVHCQR